MSAAGRFTGGAGQIAYTSYGPAGEELAGGVGFRLKDIDSTQPDFVADFRLCRKTLASAFAGGDVGLWIGTILRLTQQKPRRSLMQVTRAFR